MLFGRSGWTSISVRDITFARPTNTTTQGRVVATDATSVTLQVRKQDEVFVRYKMRGFRCNIDVYFIVRVLLLEYHVLACVVTCVITCAIAHEFTMLACIP